jgi:hypothetical protein
MPFSYSSGPKILGLALCGSPYTIGSSMYLSLATSLETGGQTFNEIAPTGYARQRIAFGTPIFNGDKSYVTNINTVYFGTTTVPWGTLPHMGLHDAPSAGNLVIYENFQYPQTVPTGTEVAWAPGELVFNLQ